MKHIIVGTAGHIDHGKTTLIKALTGRETDTLREEKERGISINLGFTYFDLPSGKRVGIVDVPGHEKFIKNMLAGASGIDIVLLTIAADEGVMPQTREHLNILSLLGVEKGIVVITKKDMVDEEWLNVVIEDTQKYLQGTFLKDAQIIPVSSTTKEGINELIKAIDSLSEDVTEKNTSDFFRLPVDRVFTVSGFGTVVTGTLMGGTISNGDKVEIYTSGIEARVRNIQVHDTTVESAFAGQRVAINLSGIKSANIKRGDTLGEIGAMEPSTMIDCRLNYLKDAQKPFKNRERVKIYHGTKEVLGRVILLDKDVLNPSDTALVQISLEDSIAAKRGDRYVIRTYSPMYTIGGGIIINPNPPKRKRFDKKVIEELSIEEKGAPEEVIEQIILKNSSSFLSINAIANISGIKSIDIEKNIKMLQDKKKVIGFKTSEGILYCHRDYLDNQYKRIKEQLEIFHKKNPLKVGTSKEEIKSKIFNNNIKQKIFDDYLHILECDKLIKTNNKYVSLYDFNVSLTKIQEDIKNKFIDIYNASGMEPPKTNDVIESIKKDIPNNRIDDVKMVFELLIDTGELIKINDEFILSKKAYENSINLLNDYLNQNKEITLAEYRDLLSTSRKYAVSLLEYFDQVKITKRVGDKRVKY